MNNQLWKNNLINIEPYTAGEQSKDKDIIKLNANENPYPPSPDVEKALKSYQYGELKKYPDANVSPLKNVLAKRLEIESENIFVGNGSDDVIAIAFMAFFNSEKPILFPDITYSFYPVWCSLFKIKYKTIPLNSDFTINIRDYDQPNGGVIIPNPNAPTSISMQISEIEDIIKNNYDCIVIIDEAYIDFGGQSAIELTKKYENLLIVQTFSKSRSLAGARIGFAVGSPLLIAAMEAVKDSYNSYNVDSVAIDLGVASVEDEEYFQLHLKKIKNTRDNFSLELKKLGFEVLPSQTNFIFTTHPFIKAKDLFEYLKTQKKIFVRYFNLPKIDNHLRITIGTDEAMEKLLAGIKSYIAEKNI